MEDEILLKDYDKAASYYNSDIEACNRLALNSFQESFKAGNEEGLAKFSWLLAMINFRKEKYVKAADYYMMSNYYYDRIGESKKAARCLIELSYVNNQLKNYKFSKEDLKEVLKLEIIDDVQKIKAYNYLTEAYLGLNEKDSALKIIEDITLLPAIDNTALLFKYNNLGYLYLQAKNYDQALKFLNKCIALGINDENLSYCYNNLAYIYMEKNQLEKAMHFVSKSLEFEERYSKSQALRTRAFIYVRKKDYQLAEDDLISSLKYKPDYGVVAEGYEKIAEAFEETKNTTQIAKFWKLNSSALKEKLILENEQNDEAREVREVIFRHKKQQLLAQLTKKDRESIIIGIMSVAIILLIGYIFYDKMNKQKKDTIDNIDSILMKIRKERRK